jgi:putative ABC transport system ATP-binding protein
MSDFMIDVRDVKKSYVMGKEVTEVLHGLTFGVKKGEFVAITGPSGSGKSTLMHIIGALDQPTSGTYLLDGEDVSALAADELARIRRSKIGFVFQSFHLLPRASVLRNVELPLVYADVPHAEREQRARKSLEEAGLDEARFSHQSNQLSGGQMQRVAIARALVNNPAIILADEPTGNLDSKTGDVVLATFQRLHHEGRTIVLITHEAYVAEHADRVIVIRDGSIIEDRKSTRKYVKPAGKV